MALASATALSWRPLPPRLWSNSGARGGARQRMSDYAAADSASGGCSCGFAVPLILSWRRNLSKSLYLSDNGPNCGSSVVHLNDDGIKRKRRRRGVVMTRAGMRLDPGGGGNNDGGISRVIVNLVLAGGLTYLTLTGQLGWVFDTVLSIWILATILPIVGIAVFLWFANRDLVKGACPNCGQTLQVFKFTAKEGSNFCPYCTQPFKLEGKMFVRDEPRFSGGFDDGFGRSGFPGRGSSRTESEDSGTIVDVEAKVVDRD